MPPYVGVCKFGDKESDLVVGIIVRTPDGVKERHRFGDYVREGGQPYYADLPWCSDVLDPEERLPPWRIP